MSITSQKANWKRLDNTAKLFPVIASENLSNVFRVSVTLKEQVVPEILQIALEEILPWFDGFRVRLRRGFFWYYFEHNPKVPLVEEENTYPCQYIHPRMQRMLRWQVPGARSRFSVFGLRFPCSAPGFGQ